MMTIKVKDPVSGLTELLEVKPIHKVTRPSWLITFPSKLIVMIWLNNGLWECKPGDHIDSQFAGSIGEQIVATHSPVFTSKSAALFRSQDYGL